MSQLELRLLATPHALSHGPLAKRASRLAELTSRWTTPTTMRLAYLVSKYPAISHTFILREIQGLRSRGHDVHPVSVRRADDRDLLSARDRREAERTSHLLPAGLRRLLSVHVQALATAPVAYLRTLADAVTPRSGGGAGLTMQLMYFGEAILLADDLRRREIEHVHVHFANNGSDIAMLAVAFGRRSHRAPRAWSMTVHGPTDFYDVGAKRLAQKAADARGIVCISDFGRSQMMGQTDPRLWHKLHVARYGVDLPDGWSGARGSDGSFTVLNVARLASVKGQAVLLDAFAVLRKAHPRAKLVIVGDGPLRTALGERAHELGLASAVELTGPIGQDRIGDLYRSADVFCLSSFAEGLPIVLMEAMSFGLPIVSTSVMGIPELIRDGEEGLLVPPGRSDALTEALALVATDADLRRRLGLAARARIEREYTLAGSIQQIERALASVVT